MSNFITDAMVEAATMALLGKKTDPLPGVDWWASRQWRVNKVREKMRKALEAAALAGGAPVLVSPMAGVDRERLVQVLRENPPGELLPGKALDPWNNGQPLDPLDNLHPRTEQAAPSVASGVEVDQREAFLDHWVKDVPVEYRAAARERADKDLLLDLGRGPLRIAADAWQAGYALAAPGAAIAAREQEASNWLWRHKKSGGLYRLIGAAQLQTDKPLNDLSEVEVYQSEDGRLLWVRDAAEFRERFERAQPLVSRQESPAAKPPSKTELLSQGEQRAILEDAGAIIRLVNYHDVKETEADAADCAGAAAFHMKRAHELLTIGRCVILRDPDLWDEQLKQEFAPRGREI